MSTYKKLMLEKRKIDKKITKYLFELLIDNSDNIVVWNQRDRELVNVCDVCINGNAVQLTINPVIKGE